jgi:hypothetical protein
MFLISVLRLTTGVYISIFKVDLAGITEEVHRLALSFSIVGTIDDPLFRTSLPRPVSPIYPGTVFRVQVTLSRHQ